MLGFSPMPKFLMAWFICVVLCFFAHLQVQDFLIHFWRGMPAHLVSLMATPAIIELVAMCDVVTYQVGGQVRRQMHMCVVNGTSYATLPLFDGHVQILRWNAWREHCHSVVNYLKVFKLLVKLLCCDRMRRRAPTISFKGITVVVCIKEKVSLSYTHANWKCHTTVLFSLRSCLLGIQAVTEVLIPSNLQPLPER